MNTAGRLSRTLHKQYGCRQMPLRCLQTPMLKHKYFSTTQPSNGWAKDNLVGGRLEALMMNFGFRGFTVNPKEELENASTKLYVSCSEYSDFNLFKDRFRLNDSFACWTDVLHLHMWMLSARCANHHTSHLARDFKFLTDRTHVHMWEDINARSKKIAKGSIRKKSLRILGDHYPVVLLSYDYGYYTDDKKLAGALWRCLLGKRETVEPKELFDLVNYIHKNMHHLQSQTNDKLLRGCVSFLPLDSDKPNAEKDRLVQELINEMP